MGFTAEEFVRLLPAAMRDWPVEGGPNAWEVVGSGGGTIARIRIQPGPERAIGALRLPVLVVTIDLAGTSPAVAEEFMRRFERGFHRGGG